MNTMVVYIDKLFIGNLLADSLIIWAAGRLGQVRAKAYRILIASCIGSLYSVALFMPGTDFLLAFYVKFAVSLVIVLAAFAPLPPRKMVICMFFFYLVSFVSGGAVIGASYFLSSAGGIGQVINFSAIVSKYMWSGLIFAAALVWIGVALLPRYFKTRQGLLSMKLTLTIFIEGREVKVRGLIDTGSSLCDPVSGEPVVVVEHGALKDLLPGPMKDAGACSVDAITLIERMMDTPWSGRLRLIPFHSLGNDSGILLGLRPDRIEFVMDNKIMKIEKVVIGLHGRRLNAGRDYDAIINPSLLEWAETA